MTTFRYILELTGLVFIVVSVLLVGILPLTKPPRYVEPAIVLAWKIIAWCFALLCVSWLVGRFL